MSVCLQISKIFSGFFLSSVAYNYFLHTDAAIFCIQKLMEAVGKSIRCPQRTPVSHGSLMCMQPKATSFRNVEIFDCSNAMLFIQIAPGILVQRLFVCDEPDNENVEV